MNDKCKDTAVVKENAEERVAKQKENVENAKERAEKDEKKINLFYKNYNINYIAEILILHGCPNFIDIDW